MGIVEKRDQSIDLLRGMCILFMILGHIPLTTRFDIFIHAFHMPVFFLISGWFFRKEKLCKFREYIMHSAKKLLVPYIKYGFMYFFIWLIFVHDYPWYIPLRSILLSNTDDYMPIGGALWFLTCSFFANIIFFCILSIANKKGILVLSIIISFAGMVLSDLHITLPWGLVPAFVAVGFYYIGYVARQYEDRLKQFTSSISTVWIVGISLLTVFSIFKTGYINMRIGVYGFVPLFWINAILASFLLWISVNKLHTWSIHSKLIEKILRIIQSIGENSFYYLCLNQLFLWVGKRSAISMVTPLYTKKMSLFLFTVCSIYCIVILKKKQFCDNAIIR